MALLDTIKTAVSDLDAKVSAHIEADSAAVAQMIAANQALQDQVKALTEQLANAGVPQAEIDGIVAQINAVAAKL